MIVDDDEGERLLMERSLRRVGVQTVALDQRIASFDALAELFERSGADVAIVDHKLREANFAPFLGADAVADLRGRHRPAVLVTRHGLADVHSIRKLARDIPSYLRRDEFSGRPDLLLAAAERAVDVVLNGARPADTELRLTVVHVADVGADGDGPWIDTEINAWSRDSSVRLHLQDVAPHLVDGPEPLTPGTNLVGHVNTSAAHPEMLVVERLRFARTQPDEHGELVVPRP